MPMNNVDTLVKTTPTTTPSSFEGVVNQLRYWGMSNPTGSGRVEPELQSKMGRYGLQAVQNLASLQRRAAELQSGYNQAVNSIQAGASQDQIDLQRDEFNMKKDASSEDLLSIGGKILTSTIQLGKATRFVASEVGAHGLANFLDKVPFIGRTKAARNAEELQKKMLESYKNKDLQEAESYAAVLNMWGDFLKVWGNRRTKMFQEGFTEDQVNEQIPIADLNLHFDRALNNFDTLFNDKGIGLDWADDGSFKPSRF